MEIDRKELKRQARERMALTDPKFWVVALAYIAMTTGVAWLVSLIPVAYGGTLEYFLQLLLRLYVTVVQFGLCLWGLWTYRQLDPGVNSLMQGFSVAGRVILMEVGIYIRILGWYLLIALGLSVPVVALVFLVPTPDANMAAFLLFAVALLIALIALRLRYALAPYLLADRPDDGPTVPIRRSAGLMRGWKMDLFKLEFSFIGWEAINFVLSLGVTCFFLNKAGLLAADVLLSEELQGQVMSVIRSAPVVILSTLVTVPVSLWLLPYRETARAGFYDARLLAAAGQTDRPDMPPL